MIKEKKIRQDHEYTIMSEITENENLTQRDLSDKLGVSVSTVNVLMKKMVREGLVKMDRVSQKQVLYMLTPSGLVEKAEKTVRYLKRHYRVIYESVERIKEVLLELSGQYDVVYVLSDDVELQGMVETAVGQVAHGNLRARFEVLEKFDSDCIDVVKKNVLLHMIVDREKLVEVEGVEGLDVVDLGKWL